MIIRRYYPKGFKGKTYSEEYLEKLREKGVNTDLIDTANTEVILSPIEQREAWNRCTEMVMNKPRWVLDNLDRLCEFKVGWEHYGRRKKPKGL